MNEELVSAVRQAIDDAEGAAGRDHLLTVQARAVVEAVEAAGFILPAGVEYGVKRGDVTEELGFNTAEQAALWATENLKGPYTIHRRPVGTWEQVDGTPGRLSGSPEATTDPDEDKQ